MNTPRPRPSRRVLAGLILGAVVAGLGLYAEDPMNPWRQWLMTGGCGVAVAWALLAVLRGPGPVWIPSVALGVAAGLAVVGTAARAMVFPGCEDALPAKEELEPGARIVTYTTEDGVALRGVAAVVSGGTNRAVVCFHGNGSAAVHAWGWARALRDVLEANVFVAEYRGYAGCPGRPTEAGLLRDARAAKAWVEAEWAPEEWIVAGRSLGSGVASGLAAELKPARVILISPFTSVWGVADGIAPWPLVRLVVPDRFDSLGRLQQIDAPVLVIHGDADRMIPYAHGQRLVEVLGDRATMVTLKGRGHNDLGAFWEDARAELEGRP